MLRLLVASSALSCAFGADVFSFANAVGDGMILAAAPKQAMVWGFLPPASTAAVSIAFCTPTVCKTIAATVGPDQADGARTTWRALLPATAGSFDKHNLTATDGATTLALAGVMFGEVWICSGQSNMEYPLGTPTCWNATNINCTDHTAGHNTAQCKYGCVENAGEEIAAMAGYDASMRLLDVPHNSQKAGPVADAPTTGWLVPSAMGGKFSAMCWFFGRDLYEALGEEVPVGLIQTTWGGTPDQVLCRSHACCSPTRIPRVLLTPSPP
jgi:sialate O-acetylesterase